MSAATSFDMSRDTASRIAAVVLDELKGVIARGVVAGSVRRGAERVRDIDIVVEPHTENGALSVGFMHAVTTCPRWTVLNARPTGHTRQWKLASVKSPDVKIELWCATPLNFGWILLLRTGDREFTTELARSAPNAPIPHRFDEGCLWRDDGSEHMEIVPTPDEPSVFAALGLPFVEPHERRLGTIQRLLRQRR